MPKKISEISQDGKGICGFTCIAQFIIDNNKISLADFNKKYKSTTQFAEEWLSNEMKKEKVKGSDEVVTALNASVKYTGTFGDPFSDITIETLMKEQKWDWAKRPGFALIPEAICHYLSTRYSMNTTIEVFENYKKITSLQDFSAPGIYGLARDGVLKHWVYVDNNGELMTWEKTGEEALKALGKKKYEGIMMRIHAS